MGFFQPGDSKTAGTTDTTPSPAYQAASRFRYDLLGQLLNAAGSQRSPGFANFTKGAGFPSGLPAGAGAGIPQLIAAMSQPGAFTSTQHTTGSGHGPTPSGVSDLVQLGVLGALVNQALGSKDQGGIANIWDWLKSWHQGGATAGAAASGLGTEGVGGFGAGTGVDTPIGTDTSTALGLSDPAVSGVNYSQDPNAMSLGDILSLLSNA